MPNCPPPPPKKRKRKRKQKNPLHTEWKTNKRVLKKDCRPFCIMWKLWICQGVSHNSRFFILVVSCRFFLLFELLNRSFFFMWIFTFCFLCEKWEAVCYSFFVLWVSCCSDLVSCCLNLNSLDMFNFLVWVINTFTAQLLVSMKT